MRYQFDLLDLSLVNYVAEGGSLTFAAERAFLSMPAVSTRIKNLEEGLGVKLFDRTRRGFKLTEAGVKFRRRAAQILGEIESLRDDMREYAFGAHGSLRICATTPATVEFLPTLLSTYLAANKEVRIDVVDLKGDEAVTAIREGTADIGIISNTVYSEGLHVVPYRTLNLVLVTSTDHPLAHAGSVRFADTLDHDYVGLPESTAYQHFLVTASSKANKPLNLRVRVNNFEAVCRMVELNIGVALLPEVLARRSAGTLKPAVLQLGDLWASRQLLICTRPNAALPWYVEELVRMLVEDGRRHSYEPGLAAYDFS